MLERLFGAAFKRVIVPIGKTLARLGLSANAVTVIGFLITLAAAYVIATGHHVTAAVVLLAGAVFDTLDGAVARATGTGSVRGAFLDSTLDRLSDAAMFIGIIWRFFYQEGPAIWAVTVGTEMGFESAAGNVLDPTALLGAGLALITLVLSLMVSYVRARAEGLGFKCRVGIAERPERIIIVALGLLFDQLVWALALLAAVSLVTLIQRFVHVWQQAKV